MSKDIILKAENISKQYRLGQVGTGTLSHDLNQAGKENPYLKIEIMTVRPKGRVITAHENGTKTLTTSLSR
jgi:hypothetical protein